MDTSICSDPSPLISSMGSELVTSVTVTEHVADNPKGVGEEKELSLAVSASPIPIDGATMSGASTVEEAHASPPPALAPPPVTTTNADPATTPRIVTRKRSSLSAPVPAPLETAISTVEAPAKGPPKKKKKYTPKPKNSNAKPKKPPTSKPTKKSAKEPKGKKGKKGSENEGSLSLCMPPPLVASETVESISPAGGEKQQPIRQKLQLPKLTKMPESLLTPVPPVGQHNTAAPPDEDNEEEAGDSNEMNGTTAAPGKQSRKKKSKGRNGNIYIGVFNRIEWMNLQNEFGFQSVNNFGTFVLQTMKRVHGDISFWCELAKASGVYPELDKYVWTNGFPYAVNLNGEHFTPAEVSLSEEEQEEVIELGRALWEQRLQQLRAQQQLSLSVESGTGPGSATLAEEAEDFDNDEEDAEDPGLENYLENMASNEGYSPPTSHQGASALLEKEKDVNRIWEEQLKLSNAQNGKAKCFATLFNLVNSIEQTEPEPSSASAAPTINNHVC